MRRQFYCVAAAILLSAAASGATRAEGALAIGITPNFAQEGFAVGGSINYSTRAEAERRALDECRGFKGAPKASARCEIVATFRRECYAIAFDPDADTHGYGFAVSPTRQLAEDRALAACRMRSDENRKNSCKLDLVRCDERD
ncbi:MAG: DUF4189 domain-containing protein [Xanthobacteraceae bacterium]|nr:DUF4189 domain-containing protein [Xanthobacteraceae bacterium]MBX3524164.1 DUF4189 domain-containing protein [Xanthobacteraceae bacterium]MBX3533543.1 DUF4189 domain-containing protein [Xanthobacteraceae bacterium]MBX3550688.1 DUF4189 domain-containing protein [Xanthobacteraceae bacterium]MCW5675529.1 DUF4189 domain-containing protein [Xanthobacteraceae bacterium]